LTPVYECIDDDPSSIRDAAAILEITSTLAVVCYLFRGANQQVNEQVNCP